VNAEEPDDDEDDDDARDNDECAVDADLSASCNSRLRTAPCSRALPLLFSALMESNIRMKRTIIVIISRPVPDIDSP